MAIFGYCTELLGVSYDALGRCFAIGAGYVVDGYDADPRFQAGTVALHSFLQGESLYGDSR